MRHSASVSFMIFSFLQYYQQNNTMNKLSITILFLFGLEILLPFNNLFGQQDIFTSTNLVATNNSNGSDPLEDTLIIDCFVFDSLNETIAVTNINFIINPNDPLLQVTPNKTYRVVGRVKDGNNQILPVLEVQDILSSNNSIVFSSPVQNWNYDLLFYQPWQRWTGSFTLKIDNTLNLSGEIQIELLLEEMDLLQNSGSFNSVGGFEIISKGGLCDIPGTHNPNRNGDFEKKAWDINIFPNPTSGKINIESFQLEDSKLQLLLFDSKGRKVITTDFVKSRSDGMISYPIDISSLENGLYYLTVRLNGKIRSYKIIKMN